MIRGKRFEVEWFEIGHTSNAPALAIAANGCRGPGLRPAGCDGRVKCTVNVTPNYSYCAEGSQVLSVKELDTLIYMFRCDGGQIAVRRERQQQPHGWLMQSRLRCVLR